MSLPLPTLTPEATKPIDAFLKTTVAEGKVPAVFFGATNAKETIYFNQGGEKVAGNPGEGMVDEDTVIQIFSMTKLITTIACLRAVDAGIVDLDSEELVEQYLPEFTGNQILEGYTDDGKEILKPATLKVTLKNLLSHTAGYDWNSPHMARWRKEHNKGLGLGPNASIADLNQPLNFEPGTQWRYSIGIDWAGELLSRVYGKSLEEIFKEHIFAPCGMTSTSFYPTEALKSRMMNVATRDEEGAIVATTEPALGRTMDASTMTFCSGGGGLFSTAKDYLAFLRHVLASSPANADPPSTPLISKSSFELLFTHTCPTETVFGPVSTQSDLARMAKDQNVHDPVLLSDGTGDHIGHSVGLFLNLLESKHGRKAGSGCWDGAAKTYFWIDPASGLAGLCCTNLLARSPDPINYVYNGFERALYDAVEASK
ncbi:hypothetical protein MNV49_001267 [Pseudohyphozyma bogoriensis]|nr:hypothetical protein MNV49_001267 [Pseudohyphozyma bogoriensis]